MLGGVRNSARSDHWFPWQQIVSLFGKRCCNFFFVVLDGILFKLTGNDDIHKSMDEFEIRPDLTTDHRVRCP